MVLRGVSSGAQATIISSIVSDDFGDLLGSIFIQDPNQTPTPTVRIRSGTREFSLHLVRVTLPQLLARLQFLLLLVDILQLVQQGLFKQILELNSETTTVTNLSTINLSVSVLPPPPPPPLAPPPYFQYLVVGTPLEELGVKSVVFVDGPEITEEELVTYREFMVEKAEKIGEEEIETR